jgi:hypothetical protein
LFRAKPLLNHYTNIYVAGATRPYPAALVNLDVSFEQTLPATGLQVIGLAKVGQVSALPLF